MAKSELGESAFLEQNAQTLLEQIRNIARNNENTISRTIIEDLLKESHIQNITGTMEQILSELEGFGIQIDPPDYDETYPEEDAVGSVGHFVPADVSIRPRSMSVDQMIARLTYDEIDLQPSFQRKDNLWTLDQQSRLIESLMLKIPLPSFYFDATNDDKWIVIDGLQRLTCFRDFFVTKKLKLSNLEYLTEMNDKFYSELPRQYVRRLLESNLTIYTVEKGTPTEIVYNIFKRINTGGVTLEPQEIRHALYQGKATKLIEKLSKTEAFITATGGAISSKRMLDCEYITRFLAFTQLDYEKEYEDNIDQFLIRALKRVNTYTDSQISMIEERFSLVMEISHTIFGKYTFRRILPKGRRGMVNKAIYELWCVCLYDVLPDKQEVILKRREDVYCGFQALLKEKNFSGWINNGDKKSMISRIKAVRKMLEAIINDS